MKYVRTPKPKRPKSQIPFRLNLLFFVVFLLLAALIGQLAYLQIINGSKFAGEVDRTDQTVVAGAVPRGLMYDVKGRPLVTNTANNAITYTKSVGTSAAQMYGVANRLANYLTITPTNLQPRDYADYYLADADHAKAVTAKLPKSQQTLTDASKLYKLQAAYVQAHMPTFTSTQREAVMLFKIMNGATQLTTVLLKSSGVTVAESSAVGEHLTSMPGVNLGTDWEREYPNGSSLTSIIGTVSSAKSGLPASGLTSYLANGYARNDRVGTSYLEQQYESILKGAKSRTQVDIGSDNSIINQVQEFKGKAGENLNLTIDLNYQKQVEKVLTSTFKSALSNGAARYSDGAYAIAMNPQTGAVLAVAGLAHDTKTNEITDDALGSINRSFVMGSAVKGAMVLGALQDGVITVKNNTQVDTPIYLPATAVKKSVYPAGTFATLTATKALEVSSNIYMMRLAMKEGHASYVPKSSMTLDDDIFEKMRGYFGQYGLGQKTGIDLPGEVSGLTGDDYANGLLKVGSALDLAYGNYDGYTLMQMAQYISTVANNGYRMKPYVVQSIAEASGTGKSNRIVETTTPSVLGKTGNTQAQLDLVKQGMWQVVHGTDGWTTATSLNTLNPGVAGKTGTAQTFTRRDPTNSQSELLETTTQSFVGFAPAKNPKIAIAVVFPNLRGDDLANYNLTVAKTMFSTYYQQYNIAKQSGYSAHETKLQ